jgi:hypothetical protein
MSIGNQPPPIINETKPESAQQQFIRERKPKQTAWISTFKRLLKVPNTRYAFLWLAGGILFSVYGKRAIRRRDEEIMIQDLENYLKNKNKKDVE